MGDVRDMYPDGELPQDGPQTLSAALERIADLEGEVTLFKDSANSWRLRYENLQRSQVARIEADPMYDVVKVVFDYWRDVCKHPRSKLDKTRFELAKPIVKAEGIEMSKRAIDGAAYDPFTKTQKNGKVKRYDGFDLIFRDRAKFEDFCNRAPGDYAAGQVQPNPDDDAPGGQTALA